MGQWILKQFEHHANYFFKNGKYNVADSFLQRQIIINLKKIETLILSNEKSFKRRTSWSTFANLVIIDVDWFTAVTSGIFL